MNHTSVVYILSLEVGGRDLLSLLAGMDETARLFQQGCSSGRVGTQYIVREAEGERAPEIAGEFYPNGDAACGELAEASVAADGEEEVIARICELTHRLGYNRARTETLLGQWARDLIGLERSLSGELEARPEELPDPSTRASLGGAPTASEGLSITEDRLIRIYE